MRWIFNTARYEVQLMGCDAQFYWRQSSTIIVLLHNKLLIITWIGMERFFNRICMILPWYGNIFTLLILCELNSSVTGGYTFKRTSNAELSWCFSLLVWISRWTKIRIADHLRRSCDVTVTYTMCNYRKTHWGPVMHICVGDLTIIGSDNGLSHDQRQAIIRTNA